MVTSGSQQSPASQPWYLRLQPGSQLEQGVYYRLKTVVYRWAMVTATVTAGTGSVLQAYHRGIQVGYGYNHSHSWNRECITGLTPWYTGGLWLQPQSQLEQGVYYRLKTVVYRWAMVTATVTAGTGSVLQD